MTADWLVTAMRKHDPASPAIDDGQHVTSYEALLQRSAALAETLPATDAGQIAFVNAPRSHPGTVAWLLAAWLAGFTPILCDSTTSGQRRGQLIESTHPSVLIEAASSDIRRMNASTTRAGACPDPAYIATTSGSTGQRKLALCRWRGLQHVSPQLVERYYLDRRSRVLQFASPSYDAYYAEVVPVLLSGGTIVCVGAALAQRPARLWKHISSVGVSHVTFPPSFIRRLPLDDTVNLTTFVSAGEGLDGTLAGRLLGTADHVINAYGPCEATICATTHEVTSAADPIPIGRPLDGIDVSTRDGMLTIAGPTVAWGYLSGDPGGFESREGEATEYLSGDVVESSGEGYIFVGRVDRQAKVRGHRLDLSGVEMTLRTIEGVQDCVVTVVGDSPAAVVVSSRPVDEIAAAAREWLPTPEWPSRWAATDSIPYLQSDKIDHEAVDALLADGQTTASAARLPDWLAAAWATHAPFGDSDDFFMRGGDSLSAMALLDTIYANSDVDIDLGQFLATPTLSFILAALEKAK